MFRVAMRRIAPVTVLALGVALAAPAFAGELVELRTGKLVEAEQIEVTDRYMVLHVLDQGADGGRRQLHVRLRDIAPESAARAWASTLGQADFEGWLKLAEFARTSALFDVADFGFSRAAKASPDAQRDLDDFRAARPREESRHHFESAHELFRSGRPATARERAREAVSADVSGPYADLARELIDMVESGGPTGLATKNSSAKERRALRKLEILADRGTTRLSAARAKASRQRLDSATRVLGDVVDRLDDLASPDSGAAIRERAAQLADDLRRERMSGLLLLADLSIRDQAHTPAMLAVHEMLAIDPEDAHALDLRARLLDVTEWERDREQDLVWRGSRRLHHPYPYPARGINHGLGLVPTRNSLRGLGKIPYTRPRWGYERDSDDEDDVVLDRPPRPGPAR